MISPRNSLFIVSRTVSAERRIMKGKHKYVISQHLSEIRNLEISLWLTCQSLPPCPNLLRALPAGRKGVPSGVGALGTALWPSHWIRGRQTKQVNHILGHREAELEGVGIKDARLRRAAKVSSMSAQSQVQASVRKKKPRTWQRSRMVCREEHGADVKRGQGEVRKRRH